MNDIKIPKELKSIGQKVLNNEELNKLETLILLFASYSYCYGIFKEFQKEEEANE